MRAPYGVLFHHWEELTEAHACLQHSAESHESKIKNEHLDVLIGYITPILKSLVAPIKRRLAHDTPAITWNDLWYLLRPGSKCYRKLADE